jgi:hypothetical protein
VTVAAVWYEAAFWRVEAPMFVRMRDCQSRSIAEAISWRITGTADTFELSVIVTSSQEA